MSSVPYIQDSDKWVSYFMQMADKKTQDRKHAYIGANGVVLFPVESERIVYNNDIQETPKNDVNIELVSPLERAADQNVVEVKIEKQDLRDEGLPPPIEVDIKPKSKMKTVIRRHTGKRSTLYRGDQLTKRQKWQQK